MFNLTALYFKFVSKYILYAFSVHYWGILILGAFLWQNNKVKLKRNINNEKKREEKGFQVSNDIGNSYSFFSNTGYRLRLLSPDEALSISNYYIQLNIWPVQIKTFFTQPHLLADRASSYSPTPYSLAVNLKSFVFFLTLK